MAESEKTSIARRWLSKNVSAAINQYATIEELLEAVSMRLVLRLYKENQWELLVSRECESVLRQSPPSKDVSMKAEESPLLEAATEKT
jgi:hypothetical protein